MTVGIWGFGREGAAALRWIRGRDDAEAVRTDVVVVDDDPARVRAADDAVDVVGFDALMSCAAVWVSPGVRPADPRREQLAAAGIRLRTGTDEFLRRAAARTVGVTGTKGKSTTTTFVRDLLAAEGADVELGGNMGVPLLDLLDPVTGAPRNDRAVFAVELSSYQCASITVSPRVAVLTQLHDDHLVEHGTRDAYWRAKTRIFASGAGTLVADAGTVEKVEPIAPDALTAVMPVVGPAVLPRGLGLPRHVAANLAAAVSGAASLLGRPLCSDRVAAVAAAYTPLPHRLAPLATADGVTWVDDALATTQESVLAALDAYPDRRVALLLGGRDRGQPVDRLAAALRDRPEVRVLLVGETTERFAAELGTGTAVGTVERGVEVARSAGVDVVLLSPGAASYDQFADHRAKGAAFAAAVAAHR